VLMASQLDGGRAQPERLGQQTPIRKRVALPTIRTAPVNELKVGDIIPDKYASPEDFWVMATPVSDHPQ
jgi:hypothetical protein